MYYLVNVNQTPLKELVKACNRLYYRGYVYETPDVSYYPNIIFSGARLLVVVEKSHFFFSGITYETYLAFLIKGDKCRTIKLKDTIKLPPIFNNLKKLKFYPTDEFSNIYRPVLSAK